MNNRLDLARQSLTVIAVTLCFAMMLGCGAANSTSSKTDSKSPSKVLSGHPNSVPRDAEQSDDNVQLEKVMSESSDTSEKSLSEKADSSASDTQPLPAKPKRDPIYDTAASGDEQIAAAVRRAQRDQKHVLIEWGGNWCGWCYRLHDVFTKNPDVRPIVLEEFELVLIDSNSNQELLAQYGGKDKQFSYPHLTILDAEGKVLTNQNTEPLEEGNAHSPARVAEFLKKWLPAKIESK